VRPIVSEANFGTSLLRGFTTDVSLGGSGEEKTNESG